MNPETIQLGLRILIPLASSLIGNRSSGSQLGLSAADQLIDVINAIRAEAVRSEVMTPEQDREFDLQMQTAFSAAHWQKSTQVDP